MGHLQDDWSLTLLYNAVDAVAVPSRQENLAQAATEAQACGCPVAAFNVAGMPDAVVHGETGYLAHPFDVDDLGHGIAWILADKDRWMMLSHASRQRAVALWSPSAVVTQYLDVFQQACCDSQRETCQPARRRA
jgi:glycosyltransferase involved in cell wall biosynthesis